MQLRLTMLLALKLSTGAFIASSKLGISPRLGVPGMLPDGEAVEALEAATGAAFFAEAFEPPAFGEGFFVAMDASSSLCGGTMGAETTRESARGVCCILAVGDGTCALVQTTAEHTEPCEKGSGR